MLLADMTAATSVDPLIERARKGDAQAWDKLVALHGRRVMLVLLARGVRAARAEEIVQETWARLIAKSKQGALERLELPGLAITQAVRASIDDQRADKTRRAASLDDPGEGRAALDVADADASPLDRLVTRDALERALAELDRCPPRAREIFELVYDNPELPHAEAAERAGLSVQRLRQTLCEVRARLRAAMVEED
jgi:RNA polymerase sigma-70 factor (ECF subfamily)